MPDPDQDFNDAENELDGLLTAADDGGSDELDSLLADAPHGAAGVAASLEGVEPVRARTQRRPKNWIDWITPFAPEMVEKPIREEQWYDKFLPEQELGAAQTPDAESAEHFAKLGGPAKADGNTYAGETPVHGAASWLPTPTMARSFGAGLALPFAGGNVGAVGKLAASPAGQFAARTGANAAMGALQGGLAGTGDVATDTAVGGALGGAIPAIGEAAGGVAKWAGDKANRLMTHTFMTPAQRSALVARKGQGSLEQLGADADKAGLFKKRNWMDYLRPTTASRVADNASNVMETAGRGIGQFEDDLVSRGVNPDVPVDDIADGLRSQAQTMRGARDLDAARDASVFERQADTLARTTPEQVSGEIVQPPPLAKKPIMSEPVQESLPGMQEPGQTELPLESAPPPQLGANTQALEPTTAQVTENSIPLSDAITTKRFQGNKVNWQKNPYANTVDQAQDTARKYTWGQLKDTIGRSLDSEAAAGRIDPKSVAKYRQDNKDFSTAATAYDPALRMSERQDQVGLSLPEMIAGGAIGGPAGALTTMAAKAGRGSGAAATAATLKKIGVTSGGIAKGAPMAGRLSPIAAAQQTSPDASKDEVQETANEDLKERLQNWWERLLP